MTALRTLLSRGFLLGSLVEERMPVPQLLAKVFLERYRINTRGQSQQKPQRASLTHVDTQKQPHCTTWPQMDCEKLVCYRVTVQVSQYVLKEQKELVFSYLCTHLSKNVASRRRSKTLCLIPAHR